MGVLYNVACKDCKKKRDLDKISIKPVYSRGEAIAFSKELIEKDYMFREGLLLSFMSEHMGHDCVFFDDNNCEELHDYEEDCDFWD